MLPHSRSITNEEKAEIGSWIYMLFTGCSTNVLTHDFSRGQAHLPFVCQTVLTVSKYDLAIKTDKSV